jgi:para-nitrobenzyl esterase
MTRTGALDRGQARGGAQARDAVAVVAGGALRGTRHRRVVRWAGVPYAGSLAGRWLGPPAPAPAWGGVAAADRFGPSAPQPPGLLPRLFGVVDTQPPAGDDCLNLNIWSADPPGAGRGVLVWVHGGGFLTGAGSQSWFDGASFAGHGVVTVTVNYRLGALGFADLGPSIDADAAAGLAATNRGLLDLVAALTWVRDNIEAFGGDPGAVTVAGQSAGAMCIGALLGMPSARGLFRRVILQSGACQTWWGRRPAAAVTSALLASAGGGDGASFAAVAPDVLLDAQAGLVAPDGGPAFRPVTGTAELPGEPLAAVAGGAAGGLDILIGTNAAETRLFALPDPGLAERTERRLATAGPGGGPVPLAAYRAARPGAGQAEVVLAALDDLEFRLPAIRLAEAQAPHGEVFAYRFDWPTPALGGRLGACHTLEIPFVWNTGGTVLGAALTGGGTPAWLAGRMHAAWVSFVTTGRPVVPDVAPWAPYDPADRTTMIFGPVTGPVPDPGSVERRAWDR